MASYVNNFVVVKIKKHSTMNACYSKSFRTDTKKDIAFTAIEELSFLVCAGQSMHSSSDKFVLNVRGDGRLCTCKYFNTHTYI